MKNKAQLSGVLITLLIIVGIIMVIAVAIVSSYNSLTKQDVAVENAWAKVQTAYERRLDLIPNLVATVKGSADFEKSTQTQIAVLRSQINSAKTPNDMKQVDSGVNDIVRNINIQVEAYPDLKSSQNFLALQDELAGTENRIKWERDNYNDAIKSYKTSVRTFPSNLIAGMFGFSLDKWDMFEATQGSEKPPVVNFTS